MRLRSPRLTQCNRDATCSSSGAASSRIAITAISMPRLRAPSRTRNGNFPLPAISPQPAIEGVSFCGAIARLLNQPALGSFDEANQFGNVFRAVERLAHALNSLRGIQFRAQQQSVCALDRLDAFPGKALAFETNRIHSETADVARLDHF